MAGVEAPVARFVLSYEVSGAAQSRGVGQKAKPQWALRHSAWGVYVDAAASALARLPQRRVK